jgi:RNA polymerase sigma factor (TIGR02999 family)
MSQVTQILQAIQDGQPHAADRLLPLVYDELRRLAATKLRHESPGQTLDATALVHEAYLRLVDTPSPQHFDGRAHFFAAAAESIRRILIENARRKNSLKRGGDRTRQALDDDLPVFEPAKPIDDLLTLDQALEKLTTKDSVTAELVKLRYFAGLTMQQAAELLNISHNTADKYWAYAKAFLLDQMTRDAPRR